MPPVHGSRGGPGPAGSSHRKADDRAGNIGTRLPRRESVMTGTAGCQPPVLNRGGQATGRRGRTATAGPCPADAEPAAAAG
jgi:hypothetical protein